MIGAAIRTINSPRYIIYTAFEAFYRLHNKLIYFLIPFLITSSSELAIISYLIILEPLITRLFVGGADTFLMREIVQQDKPEHIVKSIYSNVWTIGLIISGLLVIYSFLFDKAYLSFLPFIIGVHFIAINNLFQVQSRISNNIYDYVSSRGLPILLRIIFIILFCYYTANKFGYVLGVFISGIAILFYGIIFRKFRVGLALDLTVLKKSALVFLGAIVFQLLFAIDKILLKAQLTDKEFSQLVFCFILSNLIAFSFTIIAVIIEPKFYSQKNFRRLSMQYGVIIFSVTAVALCGFWLTKGAFHRYYGELFATASTFGGVYIAIQAFLSLYWTRRYTDISRNRLHTLNKVTVIALIFSISISYLLYLLQIVEYVFIFPILIGVFSLFFITKYNWYLLLLFAALLLLAFLV